MVNEARRSAGPEADLSAGLHKRPVHEHDVLTRRPYGAVDDELLSIARIVGIPPEICRHRLGLRGASRTWTKQGTRARHRPTDPQSGRGHSVNGRVFGHEVQLLAIGAPDRKVASRLG